VTVDGFLELEISMVALICALNPILDPDGLPDHRLEAARSNFTV